jgi:hypothetical protein
MLEGIKALLASEKALVGGSLVIAATILVALGHMTTVDWQTYTRDVFGLYIGGKTLQGAVSMWAETKKPTDKTTVSTEVKQTVDTETKKVDITVEKAEEKKS